MSWFAPFLICTLAACGVWYALRHSPLVADLLRRFGGDDEIYTDDDVATYLLQRQCWFLHGVWTCSVCQAVWTAGLAAAAAGLYASSPLVAVLGWLAGIPLQRALQKLLK